MLNTGESITVAMVTTQGGSAYYASGFNIDGSSVTVKWAGGAPSSGNANGLDVYTFSIIKTANNTFTVLGSLDAFE